MITLGQYAIWPYMHREILNKAAQCTLCTSIGKNLKPNVPEPKWNPLSNCSRPNEETKSNLDFGGLITSAKDQNTHFFACIDRFPK